jgi:hypothetical protein
MMSLPSLGFRVQVLGFRMYGLVGDVLTVSWLAVAGFMVYG